VSSYTLSNSIQFTVFLLDFQLTRLFTHPHNSSGSFCLSNNLSELSP